MSKRHKFKTSEVPKKSSRLQADPGVTQQGSTNHEHPLFDLQHLAGRSCVTACIADEQVAFILRLHQLSKLTWQKIQGSHRYGNGHEKIRKSDLRDDLQSMVPSDREYVLAFRFLGKAPFLGYRDDRIFIVICLDRDFTAYKH